MAYAVLRMALEGDCSLSFVNKRSRGECHGLGRDAFGRSRCPARAAAGGRPSLGETPAGDRTGHSPELVLSAARLHRDALVELGYAPDVLAPLDRFAASLASCEDIASASAVISRR